MNFKNNLLLCLGCLGTGRMYNIYENQLEDIYCRIVGVSVNSGDNLPQQVCHMCRALLFKFGEFRKMCQDSRSILLGSIQNNVAASLSMSNTCNLKKPRYVTRTTNITQYPELEYKITEVLIKSNIIRDKPRRSRFKEVSSPESVKSEFNNKYDESSEPMLTLTVDASNQPTELTSKKSNSTNVRKKNNTNREVSRKEDRVCKRAKRLYRIKGKYFETKENMSTFENLYDVDVVVLSKEQQLKDVLERKLSYNYLNGPSKCEECFKGFIDEDNYMKHYKAQHDPTRGNIVCEFCQFRYKDKRGLNQHLKSHRLKFSCRQCKYVSRTTFNAKEHYKMHGGQLHGCAKCSRSYEKLSTYLTHMRLHHPEELVWCELCGEPFIGAFGLNGHKKRAHRDLKFPPDCVCVHCAVRFTNASARDKHADISRDMPCEKLSSCAHCGLTFDSPVRLRAHLLAEHRTDKKYHDCPKCQKTFAKESLYIAHYRRMHVEATKRSRVSPQPWVCEVCGKTLPNKCRLVYHQRNHTGERPYQCPDCPKSFTMGKLLKSHARVHSSERPFACKYCPKTFKGPSALKGHENVHTGGKGKK